MTQSPQILPTRVSPFALAAAWARRDLPLLAVLVAGFAFWLNGKIIAVNTLRTYWRGDSVVVNAPRGGEVVTHLWARSDDGQLAVAELPHPHLTLDSDVITFDRAALSKLTWRDRQNKTALPPLPPTKISVVSYHGTYSEFTNPSKPN